MRTILLASAALSLATMTLAACGGEPAATTPADPAAVTGAETAPAAEMAAPAPMDAGMMAADAADDGAMAETPDNYMFHTDTTKIESVHLPTRAGVSWTATVIDPTQAEIAGASDATMADGSMHHVVQVKPLKRDVIAKVKFERRDSTDTSAPIAETRTINFMVH
jgi:hypothetical protein